VSKANFDPRDRADARLFPKRHVGGKWEYEPLPEPHDRLRYMARSGGYVMVRKPGAMPFVLSEKEWAKLPLHVTTTHEKT
jgi:hypothetical protein